MSIDHWMMFSTFAEQRYFAYPAPGSYQGIIINANMAAHAPAGLAAFLIERTGRQTKYVIDPLTHAFQHDPGVISNAEGETKSSIKAVADKYGAPVDQHVGKRPLLPSDFEDTTVLQGLVERCIDFQRLQLSSYMKISDSAKYLDDLAAEVPPYALIAPYFFLTESTLVDWLPVNVEAAQIASEFLENSGSKRFAAIVVSSGIIINDDAKSRIQEALWSIPLDGYFLWIDELDEQLASGAELRGLLQFAASLRRGGEREVINLHGGYFSILGAGTLGNNALSGVAHAPEFGEHRGVVPVGGGIPISRYYIPQLHSRIRYRDALAMFRSKGWLKSAEEFHSEVCDCEECVSTLQGDPANFARFGEGSTRSVRRRHGIVRIEFPTTEAKQRCLRHYLQRKRREYEAAANAPADLLLHNLENGERKFVEVVGLAGIAHLRLWRQIFVDEI